MRLFRNVTKIAAAGVLAITPLTFTGCDDKEKVVDIETPRGEVEVERDRDTGAVDVEVDGDE